MLDYYGLSEHYSITKEWYNGYRFGETRVYCPWDVINWCDYLLNESNARPQNFWVNTSSNDLITHFAEKAENETRTQIEALLSGKTVYKKLKLDLTYPEIDKDPENLWSVLFTTGYLTWRGTKETADGNIEEIEGTIEATNRKLENADKNKENTDKNRKDAEDNTKLSDEFTYPHLLLKPPINKVIFFKRCG